MNKRIPVLKLLTSVVLASACVASHAAVKSPKERKEKIDLADKLLDREVKIAGDNLIAQIGNPFAELEIKIFIEPKPEVKIKESLTPKELIPLLADNVKPTGIVNVGGEYILLLPDGRVKSGMKLPVEYLGRKYDLEIVNVLRNGYKFRFEDAEMEIKLK